MAVFEDEGLIGLNSPKTVLREAFEMGLIQDDELWLTMLSDRNSTAHIYNEQPAIEICRNIKRDMQVHLWICLRQLKQGWTRLEFGAKKEEKYSMVL